MSAWCSSSGSGAVVGIWGFYPTGRVEVSDIDIHDAPYAGIENARRGTLTNVTVRRAGFGASPGPTAEEPGPAWDVCVGD